MKLFSQTIKMFIWMTLLTGLLYPLIITCIAHTFYPEKAKGSFVTHNNEIVGSLLIAQKFESDRYFWPRPSAVDYNPLPSGGSNLGRTSSALKEAVENRASFLAKTHRVNNLSEIPKDLLFTSASGLDPHISLYAAYFQISRIAKARHLPQITIKELVDSLFIKKYYSILGPSYVNVFELNIALDAPL